MIHLYNTLTRKKELFESLEPGLVKIYTCGPTVYREVHIGNLRSYLLADWLKRMLIFSGFRVRHLKNITDVGHMRQEMLERGEDKIIAAARAAGKTSKEIARFYTESFMCDESKLSILPADAHPKATEHVGDCIELIKKIMEKGYAYQSGGNIYYDISKFANYGRLSGNLFESLLKGVRVEVDPLKRHPEDFTLWKAAEPGRQLKWASPWGLGFPGWHIECSAMSLKYLGESFDIHTGGVDNIFPHHEDEIAQSEAITGKRVVQFWMHGQHLLADGQKMSKSTGNSYLLLDLENRGYDPLAFRYLCMITHYRSRLNFTFKALKAAQRGLSKLRARAFHLKHSDSHRKLTRDSEDYKGAEVAEQEKLWISKFIGRIRDDLDLPGALALTWKMMKNRQLPGCSKLKLLLKFDHVLGLNIQNWLLGTQDLPSDIRDSINKRVGFRQKSNYFMADKERNEMRSKGYEVRDAGTETLVIPHSKVEVNEDREEISSAKEVNSLLDLPDLYDFSVSILAHNNFSLVERCVKSLLENRQSSKIEIVIVENGSTDTTRELVSELRDEKVPINILHADHHLGEAAGRNVTIKQSRGKYVLILDVSAEVTGDIFTPLKSTLEINGVELTGAMGLRSHDMRSFFDSSEQEVDAISIYCFAFPRTIVPKIGLMNEKYRFYRHLDLDYSFRIKDKGYKVRVTPNLPITIHSNLAWESMDENERLRKSRINYYIFLRKWHHRKDLLIEPV